MPCNAPYNALYDLMNIMHMTVSNFHVVIIAEAFYS